MRVVVTGAAGMIGSNLVHGLNAIGIDDVIAVDDLTDGAKFRNLLGATISDYFDRREFYERFARGELGRVDCGVPRRRLLRHDGARRPATCWTTTTAARRTLLDACQAQGTRLLYASSAATYGGSSRVSRGAASSSGRSTSTATRSCCSTTSCGACCPTAKTQVAGFRYFNVYGPREQHKGRMASVAFHHFNQFRAERQGQAVRRVRRLRAGRADARLRLRRRRGRGQPLVPRASRGERHLQPRHAAGRSRSTTSRSPSSTRAARRAARRALPLERAGRAAASIEYIAFPPALVGKYQCFTEADLARLRAVGCDARVRRRRHAASRATSPGCSGQRLKRGARRGAPTRTTPASARRCYGAHAAIRPHAAGAPAVAATLTHLQEPRMFKQTHRSPSARSLAATAFAAVDVNKASQAELEVDQGHRPGDLGADPRRAQEGAVQGLERPDRRASRASARRAPASSRRTA